MPQFISFDIVTAESGDPVTPNFKPKSMKPNFHLASIFTTLFVAFSATAHAADIEWVGSPGGALFDPNNWDDSVGPTEGVAFDGNIAMVSGSASGGTLVLASGRTLSLKNFTLTTGSFQGVLADSNADSVLNAVDSIINCNNVALDAVVNLTGTSEMHIFAPPAGTSRNTINGAGTATNGTKVTLSDGCKVVHENGNDAGNAGAQSVGQRIIRVVSGTSFATDLATAPLTEFSYAGPANPFAVSTTSPFTITALDPNPPPSAAPPADILVGYQLVPPQAAEVVWLPTVRTASDWQIDLNYGQISNFGYSGTTNVYLADLNGDGMSDKIWRQTANNGGTNPSQIIAAYTTGAVDGFNTTRSFTAPAGDIDVPFSFLSASKTDLVFGDIDGDKIDDSGVYVEASEVGGSANVMVWGILKSQGQVGISNDHGGFSNFVGWAPFGDKALGDKPYMGDFNGDGVADRMIYRTSSHQVFIDLSTPGSFGDGAPDYGPINLGIAGDSMSVSDINGDGKDDLVIGRDNAPPQETLPNNDLQTIYGYYNDGTGFSTLNAASPNITDIWGFGPGTGFLFGNITPLPASTDSFKVTQITSAGPEIAFSGTFRAVRAGTYQIEASLNLQAPWQIMETKEVTTAVLTNFSISDAQLDTAFGPGSRSKVFVRVFLLP